MNRILLVTGSRHGYPDAELIAALDAERASCENLYVVVGDCRSREIVTVDERVQQWCQEHGVPHDVTHALWAAEGKAAGPKRNERMVAKTKALAEAFDAEARCLAAPRRGSRGTYGCLRLAQLEGLAVKCLPDAEDL